MQELLNPIYQSVLEGNMHAITDQIQAALDSGISPGDILNEGMVTAMDKVGALFEEGEYFVPEMLISARAMQQGLQILRPHLVAADFTPEGKVVIGTVKGDLHDIGKNLVGMMLEGAAFDIVDLGTDVTPEAFVEAVQTHAPHVVGLSALLTTTMPNMEKTIAALVEAGVRDQVKVMIGGAPVTQQYADSIGADGYAADASRAVAVAKSILG